MREDIKRSMQDMASIADRKTEKEAEFSRQVLLAASSLFGILIALQNKGSNSQDARLCFALAVSALGLGIVLGAIKTYSPTNTLARSLRGVSDEALSAFREHRAVRGVSISEGWLFAVCGRLSYICFLASIALLCLYSFLLVP